MQTRREFLNSSSKAVIALGLGLVAGLTGNAGTHSAAQFDYRTFAQLVGTSFTIQGTSGSVTRMVLLNAEAAPSLGGDCFSLFFRAKGQELLDQGTYRFAHARLGKFDMFIVPQPSDQRGQYFEAVFNRIA